MSATGAHTSGAKEIGNGFSTVETLAVFAGFFTIILAIILIAINLLLEPRFALGSSASEGLTVFDFIVFFVAIVAVLVLSTVLNDQLTGALGRQIVLYVALAFGVAGPIFFAAGAPGFIYLACIGAAISFFVIIWGAILSRLTSRVLVFMFMLSCVFSGVFILMHVQLNTAEISTLLAVLFVVSWTLMRWISMAWLDQLTFVTKKQSIERHARGKGNSFTLILVGTLFGIIAVMIWVMDLSTREVTLTLGMCLILSGFFVALFHNDIHSRLGNSVKRMLALIMIVGLAPFPFAGHSGQLICVSFLFIAGTVNLLLIFDSILETSRFDQISPVWIISLEGGTFLAGVLVVLTCSALVLTFDPLGLGVILFVLISLASILQIYINNQVYPLFVLHKTSADEKQEVKTKSHKGQSGEMIQSREGEGEGEGEQVKLASLSLWRARIDEIAAVYKLSPRQKEIMELMIKGRDLSYITLHFSISRSTAKTHVSNLYHKMSVHSKQELIDLMELPDDKFESSL